MKTVIISFINLISMTLYAQDDSPQWDIAKLNTGQAASYLSPLEKEVLLELNKARSNPKLYANLYIEPMLRYFDGKLDTRNNIETNEGVKAVKDCIAQLKRTAKMDLLSPDQELSKAALRHTSQQSKTRETGHDSPNGETFEYRLRKIKFSNTAECISYGESEARGIVVSLLVDDGVPSRGHRNIILNPRYSSVGIAAGSHKVYSNMCTIDFGGGTSGG